MRHEPPPDGRLGPMAPHIPTDVFRQAQADGRPIVIVQTADPARPARSHLGPVLIGLAVAFAAMGMVAAALALFEFAVRTAAVIGSLSGPITLGLGLKLFNPKSK
ncbi:hypothetical protein FHS38_001029 [Streptomyces netropsis]|uniref:Uncharacterized protein n=1 Tax=Streptomyces netropsis TaxID=55404 RepID=A0A7W7L8H8_STRNE|nr:hypothetical protein [Streptomyces netropsis]MBB4885001.1 hypothetical protein [Streptomyces netropsis]